MDKPQKPEEMPDGVLVGQEAEEELVEDDGAEVRVDELIAHLKGGIFLGKCHRFLLPLAERYKNFHSTFHIFIRNKIFLKHQSLEGVGCYVETMNVESLNVGLQCCQMQICEPF